MKKLATYISLIAIVLVAVAQVVTAQGTDRSESDVNTPGQNEHTVTVPEEAGNAHVIDLGTSVDVDGQDVQGYAFIYYKDGFHHKPDHDRGNGGGNGGGNDSDTSSCYAFLAKDAKWKDKEDYLVDPTNNEGLDETFVRDTVANGVTKWEDAADGTVDGNVVDIMGTETSGTVDGADTDSPDGKNEVMFGDVGSEGAIAVTIVWGRFSGPPFNRELVEWDQVYDQVDFDWTEDGNLEPNKMDLDNIVTHEHGHAFGMGHPDDTCTEETMYAYAENGETKKRSLELGDITGISELY